MLYHVTTLPASALGAAALEAGSGAVGGPGGSVTVQRRFRDVVALTDMLQVRGRGWAGRGGGGASRQWLCMHRHATGGAICTARHV